MKIHASAATLGCLIALHLSIDGHAADVTNVSTPSGAAHGALVTGHIPCAISTNEIGDCGKTAPAGAIVGTSDTQTLTNKTISGAQNALGNIPDSALSPNVDLLNASQTMTGQKQHAGTATSITGNVSSWSWASGYSPPSTTGSGQYTLLPAGGGSNLSLTGDVYFPSGNYALHVAPDLTWSGGLLRSDNLFPHQHTPNLALDSLTDSYGPSYNSYAGIYQLASYAANSSNANVVAVYGQGESVTSGSHSWGANFSGTCDVGGARCITQENDALCLDASGCSNSTGLVVVAVGSGNNAVGVQLQANSAAAAFQYGLEFNNSGNTGYYDTAIYQNSGAVNSFITFKGSASVAELNIPGLLVDATPANEDCNPKLSSDGLGSPSTIVLTAHGFGGTPATNCALSLKAVGTGTVLISSDASVVGEFVNTVNGGNGYKWKFNVSNASTANLSIGASGGSPAANVNMQLTPLGTGDILAAAPIAWQGSSSGQTVVQAAATASGTLSLPAKTGTIATGPTGSTVGHVATFSDTTGSLADSGSPLFGTHTQTATIDPTAPTSTTAYTMQGLAASFTPQKSGVVLVEISGFVQPQNTSGDGIQYQIRVQTHKTHHTIAATRQTEARKFLASRS